MPRCHHYFMIPQELLFWRWRKEQQQQERRERNLHGCNNDACNLIISIFKAKLLTPISFRNFFYINAESSLHLLYPRHPISRGKCMQRILTLFYYTNVLFFCITQTNVQNYSFQNLLCRWIIKKNCKADIFARAINCKQIADKNSSARTHKPDRKYFSIMWLTRQHKHCDFGYDYWFTKTHTMPWLTALKQE